MQRKTKVMLFVLFIIVVSAAVMHPFASILIEICSSPTASIDDVTPVIIAMFLILFTLGIMAYLLFPRK